MCVCGGGIRLFSPSLIVFYFSKSFDFHVDGATLITARNCPRDTRQSDKIRRADPHPEEKHKEDSHHLTWRLISVQSGDFQSKFSSLLPGHGDSSLGGAVVSHAPFQANPWAESCPITGNRVAAPPGSASPGGRKHASSLWHSDPSRGLLAKDSTAVSATLQERGASSKY